MNIKESTLDKLLQEFSDEGIVCLGCGGDINEWAEGVNNIMLEEEITKNPQIFSHVYKFQFGRITCLLFPFPKAFNDFRVAKLAMVRFCYSDWMKWWSDFKNSVKEENVSTPFFDGYQCPVCHGDNLEVFKGFPGETLIKCMDCDMIIHTDFNEGDII